MAEEATPEALVEAGIATNEDEARVILREWTEKGESYYADAEEQFLRDLEAERRRKALTEKQTSDYWTAERHQANSDINSLLDMGLEDAFSDD